MTPPTHNSLSPLCLRGQGFRLFAFCVVLCALGLPVAARAQTPENDVVFTVEADRANPFVHETVRLTLTITSTKFRLDKGMDLAGLPDATHLVFLGPKFDEVAVKQPPGAEVYRFQRDARPVRPGALVISPAIQVGVLTAQRTFFGTRWMRSDHEIRAKPLTLTVRPLPDTGRPADFSGVVGQFSFDVSVSPAEVAVGDLITARSRIRGRGHLDPLVPPRIASTRHFKMYDPKPIESQTEGERVFEQILVPQSADAAAVPAMSFSYFDPQAGAYRTLTQGPFPIRFRAAKPVTFEPYRPPAEPKTVSGALAPSPAIRAGRGDLAVTRQDDSARLAPSQSALATFSVPKSSPVRILETRDHWVRIEWENKRGWFPRSSLTE